MLEIRILDDAQEFLNSLPPKHKWQVIEKISLLATDPMPARSKLIEGFAPLRRLKSGKYRIVYFVEGNVVKVPLVDKRGDNEIYRQIARKFKH